MEKRFARNDHQQLFPVEDEDHVIRYQKQDADQGLDGMTLNPSSQTVQQQQQQQRDNCCSVLDTAEIEELVEEIQDLQQDASDNSLPDDLLHPGNVGLFLDDSVRCNGAIKHSIVIICDCTKLATPVGLVKTIILISCVVSLACVCSTDYPALVLSNYIRFHIFSLTFTFLTVLVIFLVEILTMLLMFPVHWAHWNAMVHSVVCLLLNASSSLLIHALFENESSMPRLDTTVEMIIVSGVSGYFCALLCMLTSIIACCCYDHHQTLPWKEHPEGVLMLK